MRASGQYLAGPAFDESLNTGCQQRAHRIRPAHRPRKLRRQERADVFGIGVRGRIDRAVVGDLGCAKGHSREALAHALGGGRHQAAV